MIFVFSIHDVKAATRLKKMKVFGCKGQNNCDMRRTFKKNYAANETCQVDRLDNNHSYPTT